MAFQHGLSGLNIASKALDAIGNNVANSTTVGFKQSIAQFADLYAASLASGHGTATGIGATVNAVAQQFSQGNITVTNNPMDVAINGQGFFRLLDNDSVVYSRNGQFSVDRNGYIVNPSGLQLTGYGVDINDNVQITAPQPLRVGSALINASPSATTSAPVGINLDSRNTPPTVAPFSPGNQSSFNASTSIDVYDSLGNPHIMSMYFVRTTTPNEWEVYTALDGGTPGAASLMTFDASSGSVTGSPQFAQSFPVTTGAVSPLAFNLDLSASTQFGSKFSVETNYTDGFPPGRLSGIVVSPEGIVQGRYTNGEARTLGQIVLANFQNPDGLVPMGGNVWGESVESGPPSVGEPSSGARGGLQSAAVEDSNVDLTAELVNMITQQRAYQANAQSIKTQDQIMQTLVNLR